MCLRVCFVFMLCGMFECACQSVSIKPQFRAGLEHDIDGTILHLKVKNDVAEEDHRRSRVYRLQYITGDGAEWGARWLHLCQLH